MGYLSHLVLSPSMLDTYVYSYFAIHAGRKVVILFKTDLASGFGVTIDTGGNQVSGKVGFIQEMLITKSMHVHTPLFSTKEHYYRLRQAFSVHSGHLAYIAIVSQAQVSTHQIIVHLPTYIKTSLGAGLKSSSYLYRST